MVSSDSRLENNTTLVQMSADRSVFQVAELKGQALKSDFDRLDFHLFTMLTAVKVQLKERSVGLFERASDRKTGQREGSKSGEERMKRVTKE